jgi:hypothetical protein
MRTFKNLGMLVAVLGVVALIAGVAFVGLAIQKNNLVTSELRAQNVTLGLSPEQIKNGQVVDNAVAAEAAANVLAQHLKGIAPTYGDLMSKNPNGKYDATNPANITYTQGLTMENSFNLVILSYGVIQAVMGTGAVLILIGLAVGVTGLMLMKLAQKEEVAEKRSFKSGIPGSVQAQTN